MKKAVLIALMGVTTAWSALQAQVSQNLSFSGPTTWTPGTSIVLAVQDTYSGYGGGSWGLSYWVQVNNTIAPFLTITDETRYVFFVPPSILVFPIFFNATAGADPGFMTTTSADGRTGDLGGTSPTLVPEGSYHVTDITFALAAGAPAGTYTLRTTFLDPRSSRQVPSDFNDSSANAFARANFVFTVVPEPSTLVLLTLAATGVAIVAYRRRWMYRD